MSTLVFNQKARVAQWVAEEVEQTSSWGDYYAMGVEQGSEIIAGVVINNFNGSNATVHIAVKKVTKQLPELLRHVATYAFVQCGLNRITGMVEEDNSKALAFDEKIGFEREFVMKKGGTDGQDLVILVMWHEKCRWLKGKENDKNVG